MEVGRAPVTGMVHRHYLHRWPGVVVCTLALLDKSSVIGFIVLRRKTHPLGWEYQIMPKISMHFIRISLRRPPVQHLHETENTT